MNSTYHKYHKTAFRILVTTIIVTREVAARWVSVVWHWPSVKRYHDVAFEESPLGVRAKLLVS